MAVNQSEFCCGSVSGANCTRLLGAFAAFGFPDVVPLASDQACGSLEPKGFGACFCEATDSERGGAPKALLFVDFAVYLGCPDLMQW